MTRSVDDLLAAAQRGLVAAALATTPAERYSAAHLAALRSAAAVLAARARPGSRLHGSGSRLRSVWVLLPTVAPHLAEWAEFFAAGAATRAAAEAGIPVVSARQADDLLRDAEAFHLQICALLDHPTAYAGVSGSTVSVGS